MAADGDKGYIHTFTAEEQDRLVAQARFLEPYHHPGVDFSGCRRVLEVGCGVGAQLHILLRRFPETSFTGVDQAPVQLGRARELLAGAIAAGRVDLAQGDATALPFADNTFDGACLFWVLEHMDAPLAALKEVRRVLKPGGRAVVTEVYDSAVHASPAAPRIRAYFAAFVKLQAALGGDPDAGIKVPGLLAQAGFDGVTGADVSPTLDARMTDMAARRAFTDYFKALLLSGASQLLSRDMVTQDVVAGVAREFDAMAADPAAVFSYGARQAKGIKPRTA